MYYTALLINVGCHTDAHEQAKWFGDDIALKADKYDHGLHGVRSAAAGLRRLGSGTRSLQRFRIGLEFAVSGHRDLDDMIAHHAEMARRLADQLGSGRPVLERRPPRTSSGTARGGRASLRASDVPMAARLAQLAEFVEVAHRVGGTRRRRRWRRKERGAAVRPSARRPARRGRRPDLRRPGRAARRGTR